MARTLTGNTTTAKDKTDDVKPINIIKIEWAGSAGTKYYSDQDMGDADASAWNKGEGRVDSWGQIFARMSLHPNPTVGDVAIRLRDADQTLHGFLDDEVLENKTVTIYQHFDGNAEGDLITLFKGTVSAPVNWIEDGRILAFNVVDMGSHYDRRFANFANKDDFANVLSAHEGKMIPIVYGRVKKAPSIFVSAGRRGRLLNEIRGVTTDETFLVEGGEDFTQGESITIRVGQEHVTGEFDGIEFTPTTRGAQIASGTISGTSDNPRVFATNFTGQDGQYVGYFLKISVVGHDGVGFQSRRIIRSSAGGEIEVAMPYYYQGHVDSYDDVAQDIYFGVGQRYWVPANTGATIVTQARPHNEGEPVIEILGSYTYILNDYPSTRVDGIFGWGKKLPRNSAADDIEGLQPGTHGFMTFGTAQRFNIVVLSDDAGLEPPADPLGATGNMHDAWIPIEESMFEIDKNDSQFAGILGHNCTTITFHGLPPGLIGMYDFGSEDLFVDIHGIDDNGDGTGTVIENPSEVIQDFLETVGGVTAGDTDDTSFNDAAGRMGGLRFGFALQNAGTLAQVAQDLAFQCRCSLNWDDGAAYLRWLVNGPGASTATVTDNKRLLDSFVKSRLDFDTEIKTGVRASWTQENEQREVAVSDATAEKSFGRKELGISCWALTKKDHAKTIALFWLRRLKDIWPIYIWQDYLDFVEIQRNDTVTFTVATYTPNGAEATILEIAHVPGSGARRQIDEIRFKAVGWWCDTSCKAFCETGGCETSMQIADCVTTCETSCQGKCQLICVTATELICKTPLMIEGCEWVEAGDLFNCDSTAAETALNTSCTLACQTCGCQSCDNETSCGTTCETWGCETWGCESCGCQTCGCETVCQTGGCQTSCQTVACECGCEDGCTADCQTNCQVACVCSNQICTECQTSACQTLCEPSCEGNCQCTCVVGCECECESTDCQTGVQ